MKTNWRKGVVSMTNLNTMARKITLAEGLKKSVSIAQVKEIMKLVFKELKTLSFAEVLNILTKQVK